MRYLLIGLITLTACAGYHFDGPAQASDRKTITIPFVQGDIDGQFTDELVRQISFSGIYEYVRADGDIVLQVSVTEDGSEKIGYRYDRESTTGKLQKNLIPTESRRKMIALVSLIDAATNEVIVGPVAVKGGSEYDYLNSKSIEDLVSNTPQGPEPTVFYSLGQLDSIEGAQDDTLVPLYRDLAQKIVNGIINKKW